MSPEQLAQIPDEVLIRSTNRATDEEARPRPASLAQSPLPVAERPGARAGTPAPEGQGEGDRGVSALPPGGRSPTSPDVLATPEGAAYVYDDFPTERTKQRLLRRPQNGLDRPTQGGLGI